MLRTLFQGTLICLLTLSSCVKSERGRTMDPNAMLSKCVHEKGCAIRFIYSPPIAHDFLPIPLILRQERKQDSQFRTWSKVIPQGITWWISPEEMQNLVKGLQRLDLPWKGFEGRMSFRRERIEPPPSPPMLPWKIPMSHEKGTMEIDVTSNAGTTVAFIASKRVCVSMKPLVRAFRKPMSIYVFKGTLLDWGCKVPGFNLADRPKPPKHEKR